MTSKMTLNGIENIFLPHEHAILASYFGVKPPPGTPIVESLEFNDEELDGIGLEYEQDGYTCDYKKGVANAVARIVLNVIQDRLPTWLSRNKDGEKIWGRKIEGKRHGKRLTALIPQFLFSINWADSAPGVSWPESYHVGYIPYYDRFVVTCSEASPDAYGYSDLALGWFTPDQNIKEGSKNVIIAFWKKQEAEVGQGAWVYLFDTGIVSEQEAYDWSSEVWTIDDEPCCL